MTVVGQLHIYSELLGYVRDRALLITAEEQHVLDGTATRIHHRPAG